MKLEGFLRNENRLGFIKDNELPKLVRCIEKLTDSKIRFLNIRNGIVYNEEGEWRLNDLMWRCRNE